MKFIKRDLPPKSNDGPSLLMKFKDGESKTGVLRGEVYEFHQYWENGKSHIVGKDDPRAKSRFRLNFVTKEDGGLKSKIFEFGINVYNQLAGIAEDYEMDKTAIKITRHGTGTDTIYVIIPAKEQPSVAGLKQISEVPLNILNHKESSKDSAVNSFEEMPSNDDEGLPF